MLDKVFQDLLASHHGPGYGITVLAASPDLSVIDVDFRFIAGHTYCCAEPLCHIPSSNRRLLSLAADHGIPLPETVTVRWHCHVEQGAKLESMQALGLPVESEAYDFEFTTA